MRILLNKVAVNPNFEKVFPPLGLQPNRDVTRFPCLKVVTKPALKHNTQVLRFTRLPFGLISSSFLLAATAKCHLNKADTPVAKNISGHMCMNKMIDVTTLEQADDFYQEGPPFSSLHQ